MIIDMNFILCNDAFQTIRLCGVEFKVDCVKTALSL